MALAAKPPTAAAYTYDDTFGDLAGRIVTGEVVKSGKTYADVKWSTGRTERVYFARPDGVTFR